MDTQVIRDAIVMAGMFSLRIGLPFLLLLGLGYLGQTAGRRQVDE